MTYRLAQLAARALALVVMLSIAIVNLPGARAATVTCCCGEHEAHHDCGCADCPGGRADPDADGTPSVQRCRSGAADLVLTSVALHAPPPRAAVHVVATPAPAPLPSILVDRPADPPPSPPPRIAPGAHPSSPSHRG